MIGRKLLTWLALGALLTACSLAEDVTPPPGAQLLSSSSGNPAESSRPANSSLGYPTTTPSVAQGAAIFAQHCAACHGEMGKGDGPDAAKLMEQRTGPLPDFSTPDHVRLNTQAELFQIVTRGRLDKFMPPWQDKLSEAERWSVVAYLYTLSAPPTEADQGKTLYAEHCAKCHGEQGNGDGAEAAGLTPPAQRFTDQAFMAAKSQTDLFNAVTQGDNMHAFQDQLSEAERWAVASYVRTLSFDTTTTVTAATVTPAAIVTPATQANQGQITGQIVNGTHGASVPIDLIVRLRGFDNFTEVQTLTTTVLPDGTFQFAEVPYVADRSFMVTAAYHDLTYSSDILNFKAGPQIRNLALTIYDTASDASVLQIERMHITFDFPSGAGQANVGEMVLVTNNSDKAFVPGDGQPLEIPLPAQATGLTVQNWREGIDYVRTAQGFAFTAPLRPGPNAAQIAFGFQMPVDQPMAFEQKVLYPVSALSVMLPETGLAVQSAQLQDQGTQALQGNAVRVYGANQIAAGATLAFQLTGQAAVTSALPGLGATTRDPLPLALGLSALGAALAGVGYWWYRRQASMRRAVAAADAAGETGDDYEALLQAIAELDDAHAAGEVETPAYQRQRAQLKARALALATQQP